MKLSGSMAGWIAVVIMAGPLFGGDDPAGQDPPRARRAAFRIPVDLSDRDLTQYALINLFVSRDQGVTWRLVESVDPNQDSFRLRPSIAFRSEEDGFHHFVVQPVGRNGRKRPEDLSDLETALIVEIRGGRTRIFPFSGEVGRSDAPRADTGSPLPKEAEGSEPRPEAKEEAREPEAAAKDSKPPEG